MTLKSNIRIIPYEWLHIDQHVIHGSKKNQIVKLLAISYQRQEHSTGRGVHILTFPVWHCHVAVWHYMYGTPYCHIVQVRHLLCHQNAPRFSQSQRVSVTWKRKFLAYSLLKCISKWATKQNNQVPMLNLDRQTSVSGDTMSQLNLKSLLPRLEFVTSYPLDWNLSVWTSTGT